jgi:hypothetical protein
MMMLHKKNTKYTQGRMESNDKRVKVRIKLGVRAIVGANVVFLQYNPVRSDPD